MNRALKNRRREKVAQLTWPKRGRWCLHAWMGRFQRWVCGGREYRIDRYAEGSGRYLAQVRRAGHEEAWDLVRSCLNLNAAKRACQKHWARVAGEALPRRTSA